MGINRMKNKIDKLIFLQLLCIFSCNHMDSPHNKILFKPKPGSTYEFELNEHKQIENLVKGRASMNQSEHNSHEVLTFEWTEDSSGNGYKATVNFKSLKQTNVFSIDSSVNRLFNDPDSAYQ